MNLGEREDPAYAPYPAAQIDVVVALVRDGRPDSERTSFIIKVKLEPGMDARAALADTEWFGRLVASGFTVAPPTPLFPRLELPADEAETA